MGKPLKGRLSKITIKRTVDGDFYITGIVRGHDEFRDGTFVHTSRLVLIDYDQDPPRAETKNSLYDLEWEGEDG